MQVSDRVVLVAAGFGVWQAGRHVASARWTDVIRACLFKTDQPESEMLCVTLGLRDGTEVLINEELPGFEPFLAAAEAALSGMRKRADWLADVRSPAFMQHEMVLFERKVIGI